MCWGQFYVTRCAQGALLCAQGSVLRAQRTLVYPGSNSVCQGNTSVSPGEHSLCTRSNSFCQGRTSVAQERFQCQGSNPVCLDMDIYAIYGLIMHQGSKRIWIFTCIRTTLRCVQRPFVRLGSNSVCMGAITCAWGAILCAWIWASMDIDALSSHQGSK